MIKGRLKDILEQGIYFVHSNCTIDALLGINEDNYDRCIECSNFVQVQDKYVCLKLGLHELR